MNMFVLFFLCVREGHELNKSPDLFVSVKVEYRPQASTDHAIAIPFLLVSSGKPRPRNDGSE